QRPDEKQNESHCQYPLLAGKEIAGKHLALLSIGNGPGSRDAATFLSGICRWQDEFAVLFLQVRFQLGHVPVKSVVQSIHLIVFADFREIIRTDDLIIVNLFSIDGAREKEGL